MQCDEIPTRMEVYYIADAAIEAVSLVLASLCSVVSEGPVWYHS